MREIERKTRSIIYVNVINELLNLIYMYIDKISALGGTVYSGIQI